MAGFSGDGISFAGGSLVSLATGNRLARVLDVASGPGAAAKAGQVISCRLQLFRSDSYSKSLQ